VSGTPKERLLEPSTAKIDNPPLTTQQIQQWRNEGFALVDGLIPIDLVDRLLADAAEIFPNVGSNEAAAINDFGEGMTFPSQSEHFNNLTLHPRLLEASSQLLNAPTPALRLTQSDLWPKYSSALNDDAFDNQDQRIHMDYPNHTLTHPSKWEEPEAVEIIVYLSDQTQVGGSTAVVPRIGSDDEAYMPPLVHSTGIGDIPWINNRSQTEDWFYRNKPEVAELRERLYQREKYTQYRKGSALFYRHDVWHRGTPLNKGTVRFAQNLTFRKAEAPWINTLHPGWAWAMYKPDQRMERLIAKLSPEQRSVLGFPAPGDSYWDRQKVDAVEARYGAFGFDATPYREQLSWTGLY
tara:strand:+ start:6299 stop:7351 length:1053 start_codon:yes stop_codon:yes gene_type:complete